jgi:hypothetical protein
VTKFCYVLDEIAGDPLIQAKPQAFKKNNMQRKKQYNLI